MIQVIKRNKKRQKFSINKLKNSIVSAAREAKLGKAQGSQIAKDIAEGIYRDIRGRDKS